MTDNPTDNHNLPRPATGTFEGTWGVEVMNNDLTNKVEKKLVARDLEANRADYTPYADAIFVANDTGAVYDGDGSVWNEASRKYDTLKVIQAPTASDDVARKAETDALQTDVDSKAADPHDNTAHSETYATQTAVDGKADNPHGNTQHIEDYLTQSNIDGKADDPHGNEAHSESYTTTSPSDVDSSNWGDYEIQKNGSDGAGIINFKT